MQSDGEIMKEINISQMIPSKNVRDYLIFNNRPTSEDIVQAEKEDKIIVVHLRKVDGVAITESHEVIKNLKNIKKSHNVCAWCTGFTQEEFEEWFCKQMDTDTWYAPAGFNLTEILS